MWLRIRMRSEPIIVATLKLIFTSNPIIEWEDVGGSGILWDSVVINPPLYQNIRLEMMGLKVR